MKKSLIALAVLAASGVAMAQSSVTLFGVVDAGVGHVSATNSVSGVTQSGNSSSRLGFRGVEELGGGLKAGFWLEGALSPDVGTGAGGGATGPGLEFKRRSTVGLEGNFGEVRLGRELTVGYDKPSSYDPFGQVGLASFQGFGIVGQPNRIGNGLSYRTPALGGFFASVHYAFGEVAGSTRTGSYVGLAGGYENGPLSATLAADQQRAALSANDVKTWSLGASYDLGVVKPAFIYHSEKNAAVKYNTYMLALTAPVGPGNVIGSYQRLDLKNSKNDTDVLAVGYVYNLSKRTAVYGTYAHANNKGTATRALGYGGNLNNSLGAVTVAPGENVNGYQVGVRHAF
ncbi:MAG: porin [Burkholderiaceae bacterium]|nr:porin [Burkholderiaceae bacterium]